MNSAHQKVAASHLSRDAYLYVRQCTQRQVFDHGESTRCQYALRERAVALGCAIAKGLETARAENCQSISGGVIDRAVGELLVELMTPLTLDVALQEQDELAARAEEADLWRAQQVRRAREEADLARQRFMQTHPDNRMVADVLEAEWNAKLRALDEAQRELERSRAEPGQRLDDGQRRRILALASDLPRLWNDPATPLRERKRMARLLIEDVTLTKATRSLGVRLRGGAT